MRWGRCACGVLAVLPGLLSTAACTGSAQSSRSAEYADLAANTRTVKPSQSLELRKRTAVEAAQGSSRIVVARSKGSEVRQEPDGNIYTFFNFDVEETLKGRIPTSFSLRLIGGTLNGVEISSAIELPFQSGESYVLFLGVDNLAGYPVLSAQHIYTVATNPSDGARLVVPAPIGMTIYRKGTERVASFSDRFALLDDFRYSLQRSLPKGVSR